MSAISPTGLDHWPQRYAELLRAHAGQPSDELLGRAADLGRSLAQGGLPLAEVAAGHMSALEELIRRWAAPGHELIRAAAPLFSHLMAGYDTAPPERAASPQPTESPAAGRPPAVGKIGVWDWNLKTDEFHIDPIMKALLGYEEHEVRNDLDEWCKLVHPEDQQRVKEEVEACLKGRKPRYEVERRMLHKDGSVRWFAARGAVIRDVSGQPVRLVGTETDVTERRQAEEAARQDQQLLQVLMDNIPDNIYFKDRESRFTRVNRALARCLGLNDCGEATGKWDGDFHPPQVAEGFYADDRRVIETGEPVIGRIEQTGWDRAESNWFSTTKIPMRNAAGEIVGLAGISRDITELKRAQEALQGSERDKSIVLSSVCELITYQDRQLTVLWANRAAGESVNLAPDALVGRHCYEIWHGCSAPCVDCPVVRSLETGQAQQGEVTSPDGRAWLVRAYPVRNDEAEVTGVVEITQDITERKRIEEALRRARDELELAVNERTAELASANKTLREEIAERQRAQSALQEGEKRIRSLVETTTDWIWEVDRNGFYTYASPKVRELLGYEPEDVIGKTPFDLMPANEAERVGAIFRDAVASRRPLEVLENVNLHKDGRRVVLETSGVPVLDAGGGLVGYRGIDRDITARKRAEEALRESEARYRQLFATVSDAIMVFDAETRQFLDVNEAASRLYGYSKEEFLRLRHPDITADQEESDASIKLALAGQLTRIPLRYHKKKDGTVVPVEISATALTLGDRRVLCGVVRDITERKRAEEALHESEAKYRSFTDDVLDTSRVGIFVLDRHFRVVWVNQALERYFGLRKDELLGKDKRQLIRQRVKDIFEDSESFAEKVIATYDNNTYIENFECHVLPGDSRAGRWLEHWSQPIRSGLYAGGRVEHYTDITNHKWAVVALQESKERYRSLVDNIDLAVSLITRDHKIVMTNAAIGRMFAKPQSEFIGKSCFAEFEKRGAVCSHCPGTQAMATRRPAEATTEGVRDDGSRFPVRIQAFPVFSAAGQPTGFIEVVEDITARKLADEKLKETTELLQSIMDSATEEMIVATDAAGVILSWNEGAKRLLGYESEEVVGKESARIFHTEEYLKSGRMDSNINNTIATGKPLVEELTYVAKDGKAIPVQQVVTPRFDEDGKCVGFLGMARDITERKRVERALRESEERYRALFEYAPDAVVLIGIENGELLEFNDRAHENLGYTREEFQNLRVADIEVIESAEEVARHIERVLREGTAVFETKQRTKAGEIRDVLVSCRVITLRGRIIFQGIWSDITERKRVEEALRESEERYRSLVENIDLAVSLITRDHKIVMTNAAIGRMFAKPQSEFIGKSCFAEFEKRGAVCSHCPGTQAMATRRPAEATTEGVRDDGSRFPVRIQAFPVFSAEGEPTGFIEVVEDITERKRAEEDLRKFKTISDQAAYGAAIADLEGNLLYVNKAFAEMHGYTSEEVIGEHLSAFHTEEQMLRVNELNELVKQRGSYIGEEVWHARTDGSVFPTLMNATIITDEDGTPSFLSATMIDITERKQVDEALRESQERYRAIFEQAADSIMLVDTESGALVEFNTPAHKNLGYTREEFRKLKMPDLDATESAKEVEKHMKKVVREGSNIFETNHRTKRGEIRDILVTARGISIGGRGFLLSVSRDITDRKRAEEAARQHQEQLAHVSRVSTMGEMASGLTHQLAQPLSAILYYAKGCTTRLSSGAWGTAEAADTMGKIVTQADRAGEFVRHLKAFVRKAQPHRAPCDINTVVREALDFAAPQARENQVAVHLEPDDALPKVMADKIQIEQVILNLVHNGIEAMDRTALGERELLIRTFAGPGDTVCLSVRDTGRGLTDEVAAQVFEPFFTTKPAGTGLGLSISRTIIEEMHEGELWVGSDPQRGTVFGFTLPVAKDADHAGK